MTQTATADLIDTMVAAEDAPLGVQLWPARSPEYAPNFTLAKVATVRSASGTHVEWTYESGSQRFFDLGEEIAVRIAR